MRSSNGCGKSQPRTPTPPRKDVLSISDSVSRPSLLLTAYGVPLIRQKVTLGPGMGPNTVAKINVWVDRGNSASLHP